MELSFNHLIIKPEEVDFIIYHGGCADGFGCVLSAELYRKEKFPDKQITYYPGIFNKPPPDVSNKNVLICDFSYDKDTIVNMIGTANKLVILDHHKTAENKLLLIPDENKLFNKNYSGAYITWKFFHSSKEVPKIIEYIQDNDLWEKKLPFTLEFTAYMFSLPMTIEEYTKLLDNEFIEKEVFTAGAAMVRQNQSNINIALKNASPKFIEIKNKYYFVGHINSTVMKSEIGSKLFERYPLCNFSAIYSIDDNSNSTIFSLRSTGDRTDVSEISELFGGGGHRNASGIKLNYVTNVIPGSVVDNYKSYYLLQNINYEDTMLYGIKMKIVTLNASHHKRALGKFLLQTRYTENNNDIQECSFILKYINNNNKNYNSDIAIIWNYDGKCNKIWCTVIPSDELNNDKQKLIQMIDTFSKLDGYENYNSKINFACKITDPIGKILLKN